jgi:hypothetical protein
LRGFREELLLEIVHEGLNESRFAALTRW